MFVALIIYSCKKGFDTTFEKPRKELSETSVEATIRAKEAFINQSGDNQVQHTGKSLLSDSLLNHRTLLWSEAYTKISGDTVAVFVPVKVPVILTINQGSLAGTRLTDNLFLRMVDFGDGFKPRLTEMVSMIPDDSSRWKIAQKFNGLLFLENWYSPISSFIKVSQGQKVVPVKKIMSDGGMSTQGFQECQTISVTQCVGGHPDYMNCDVVTTIVCSDGGGGGGGTGGGGEGGDANAPGAGTAPGGGGSGGGGAPSVVIAFKGNKVNPINENKCFNKTQPAIMTIYVQQPNPNTRDMNGQNSVGHAFIGITQNGITRNLGFYPNSPTAAVFGSQTSEIHDNSGEMYHVSVSKGISPVQLSQVINYINNYPSTYALSTYNCTDFAIGVAQQGGLSLPATTGTTSQFGFTFSGRNPGDLGQDLRSATLPAGVTRTTNQTNAPAKSGNCP